VHKGAVNKLLVVIVQGASSENTAVVFTGLPSANKPVKVTVCGLEVIAKD
jgi:hypothetical protein